LRAEVHILRHVYTAVWVDADHLAIADDDGQDRLECSRAPSARLDQVDVDVVETIEQRVDSVLG
jgi:hypothetical protein